MKISKDDPFKHQGGDILFYWIYKHRIDPTTGFTGIHFEIKGVANDPEAIALIPGKFDGTWNGKYPRYKA